MNSRIRSLRDFFAEAFEKMNRLKLLKLRDVHVNGNFEYFSKDLRLVCWRGFSLNPYPDKFCMLNLVALDLQYSNLVQVWKDDKV